MNRVIDQTIKNMLDSIVCGERVKRIIIYPYGNVGMEVKRILNERYGISEAYIIDNNLCRYNQKIHNIKDIEDKNDYLWLIGCESIDLKAEIISTLEGVDADNIIDVLGCTAGRVYGNEFELFCKMNHFDNLSLSLPCREVMECTKQKKYMGGNIAIAEIGVGLGATSLEVCKLLGASDTYYCFDFQETIEKLLHDLKLIPEVQCHIKAMGNSHKLYASYNWNLYKLIVDMQKMEKDGIFDVAYLDGAHNFEQDGLACCLLKQLVKRNGYIIFDDLFWSHANAIKHKPSIKERYYEYYSEDQIEANQIRCVVNTFMEKDEDWEQIYLTGTMNPYRGMYKRKK